MAVLSDNPGISFEAILERTLVDAKRLRGLLKEMEAEDFISSQAWGFEEEFFLTNRGQRIVLNLLAAAKSHEVDALGACSADEVRALKISLKKLIESLG
jgi:DNA-binding MarR family transcriptional regulator